MDKVSAFLKDQHVCSFTVLLPDGTPHSAILHFSHQDTPFKLYFSTEKGSVKASGLQNGESQRASAVAGWSEDDYITIQMRGTAKHLEGEELAAAQEVHYAKHPGSAKWKDDPDTFFICFDVSWWRYSNLKADPAEVVSSES